VKIEFVDDGNLLTKPDRDSATRSFLFALSRFGEEIQQVTITTERTSGPKDGMATKLIANVQIRGRYSLQASQHATRCGEGLAHLARQLHRSLARELDSRRRYARRSIQTSGVYSWPPFIPVQRHF